MAYSVDVGYLNYFQNAAVGKTTSNSTKDRLIVTGVAAGTATAASARILGRTVTLINEIAKVIFYSFACLFTLGNYGNVDRLGSHCKLFVLNGAAMLALPVQLCIHPIAIIIGIIKPTAAYRLMQVGTTSIAAITSREEKIWQEYKYAKIYESISNRIASKITNLFNDSPFVLEMVMKTLICEFSSALEAGLVTPFGMMKDFKLFGANPEKITDEQKNLTPILLLNGNYCTQATFMPLLHTLKQSGNQRPVYTVNLPPNYTNTHLVKQKVQEIKKQYGKEKDKTFEVDMIGHSMGSNCIQELKWDHYDKKCDFIINRTITLGTPLFDKSLPKGFNKGFDITGSQDILITRKSILDENNRREIDTGHLGLLSHPESLQAIQDFLKA